MLIKLPGAFFTYGELKTDPTWDPLRKDPRFDKLLAELEPEECGVDRSIAYQACAGEYSD
jgi:hypothetical protein